MTTYQRLKKENAELKKQLITIANSPDSVDGIVIKNYWVLIKKTEDVFWAGDIDTGFKFQGLLNHIKIPV